MLPSKKEHPDGKDYLQPDVVTVIEPKSDEMVSADKMTYATHPGPAVQVPPPAVVAPAVPVPIAAPSAPIGM